MPNPQSKNIDAGTRLQALALAEHGVPRHIITSLTSVTSPTIGRYQRQARERGYNPDVSHALLLSYVIDKPRSGRPRKCPLDEAALVDDEGKNKEKKKKKKKGSKSGKGREKKIEGVERREDGERVIEDVMGGEGEEEGEEGIDGDEDGSEEEEEEEEGEEEEEERINLDPSSLPPTATTNFVHERGPDKYTPPLLHPPASRN